MQTKNLDVVYFVSAFPKSDLLYSIRSVAKNLEFNKLCIYGGKKMNIQPDYYVKVINQIGSNKWDKVRWMYEKVCLDDNISDDFIMFHDDFFVMKPLDRLMPEYRGTFQEHIRSIEARFGENVSKYCGLLKEASERLRKANKSDYSYELHKPFIFNKKKLLEIMELFPKAHCLRSIYANYYGLGGEKTHDVKIFDLGPDFDYKNEEILSTDDSVLTGDNAYWNYIKDKFQEKCRFEV